MCLRGSVCTGHASGSALCARGGSLFSSCSVCLSHCVHTSFILLFLALLNPTLPLAGSPGCASSFLGSWRSSVLPLPYSLSAFFHGPFPSSHSLCYVLPMRGTQCALRFSSVMGKESFDALTITAMAGITVKLWEWAQYNQFSSLSDSPVKVIDFSSSTSKILFDKTQHSKVAALKAKRGLNHLRCRHMCFFFGYEVGLRISYLWPSCFFPFQ